MFVKKNTTWFEDTFGNRKKNSSSLSKINMKKIASVKEFEKYYTITHIMNGNNNKATVLVKNVETNEYSIGKIYNCNDDANSKNTKKKVNRLWQQFQIVQGLSSMEYFGFYYDKSTASVTIHQQAYQHTLSSFTNTTGAVQNEQDVKLIANDILKTLIHLHSYGYVHTDIKPNNIMERKSNESNDIRSNGWLLTDYDSIQKNKTRSSYHGTIGWTAPELDIHSTKNVYRFSSDLFSFGLVILYIMFGSHPLEVPKFQRKQYEINGDDDEMETQRKHALKGKIECNWYKKHILKSEYTLQNHLVALYFEDKISKSLFELLHDGLLVRNESKRWSAKQIYLSAWLSDINQ